MPPRPPGPSPPARLPAYSPTQVLAAGLLRGQLEVWQPGDSQRPHRRGPCHGWVCREPRTPEALPSLQQPAGTRGRGGGALGAGRTAAVGPRGGAVVDGGRRNECLGRPAGCSSSTRPLKSASLWPPPAAGRQSVQPWCCVVYPALLCCVPCRAMCCPGLKVMLDVVPNHTGFQGDVTSPTFGGNDTWFHDCSRGWGRGMGWGEGVGGGPAETAA